MIVEIILSVLILVFGYTTFNLFRKLEKMEDVIEQYEEWFNTFSRRIDDADLKIKQTDSKGTFESDDEVGFYFRLIKDIQLELKKITDKLTGEK